VVIVELKEAFFTDIHCRLVHCDC